MKLPVLLALPCVVLASAGDLLPQFQSLLEECTALQCDQNIQFGNGQLNPLSTLLFNWDCHLDCRYKCLQMVTDARKVEGLPMVQFYGKWPFKRVLGVTELFSSVMSVGNLCVNYVNFQKVSRYYRAARSRDESVSAMLLQYLVLLGISIAGWMSSTIFHIRDMPGTETLDYVGAGLIVTANFNSITVRYFGLYKNPKARYIFQGLLGAVLFFHYTKLGLQWDYSYNMRFNMVIGLLSALLWMAHAARVNRVYLADTHFYNNSMQLLPFETKILAKLNYVGISRTKDIPLLPAALNVFLILAVSLEVVDFEPWFQLVDSHSLWHMCTMLPPIVWYDWNLWDLEMEQLSSRITK